MKLISMVDYVLQQCPNKKLQFTDALSIVSIVNYANFLKQPLKLWMFVPCDEEGNVLVNPYAKNHDAGTKKEIEQINYNNAKQKVLFILEQTFNVQDVIMELNEMHMDEGHLNDYTVEQLTWIVTGKPSLQRRISKKSLF